MGHFRHFPKLSVIAIVFSQLPFSMPAYSAGFQINEISPGLQGDATAGAAAAKNDVSAMFINPATLANLAQNQVYLGGSEIIPNVSMTNASAIHTVNVPGIPPSSITAAVQGSSTSGNSSKSAFVPDGYLGWRITDKLVAGLAILAPYGLTTHYNDTSVVRFAAMDSSVKTINITPALSYAITPQWAVGLGFQAQYIKARFTNFNGPYTGIAAIDALIAADNPTRLKGSGWGYGYTAGILFSPDPCTRLGLAYRSQVSEQLRGHGQQYTSPGPTVPAPSQDFLFNAETTVTTGVRTPAILTLSAARDYQDWTLKASAQMNFWNTFNQLSINMPQAFATNSTIITKWKNTWFGAIGAEYRASPSWTTRGGVAFDQTPTSTAYRDPRIPDANRFWLNLGATWNMNKNVSFDGSFAHIFFRNQHVNVTQANGTSATSTVPLEVNQVYADFKGSADILGLAVRYSF